MKSSTAGLFLLTLVHAVASGQQIEKIWFDKSDSTYGYYATIKPISGRIQGALVLLDGYGGNADQFLGETKVHNVAFVNDILTICIPTGPRLYADSGIVQLLNRILISVRNEFALKKEQFAIGGMSSGGTIALRYAEMCKENSNYAIFPQAVFVIDSPFDLQGLYESSLRDLQNNSKGWWLGEDKMIISRLDQDLGNIDKPNKYNEASPFNMKSRIPGNEKYLINIPFRTYHDVDVSWFLENRHRSLYQTNMLNASVNIIG